MDHEELFRELESFVSGARENLYGTQDSRDAATSYTRCRIREGLIRDRRELLTVWQAFHAAILGPPFYGRQPRQGKGVDR